MMRKSHMVFAGLLTIILGVLPIVSEKGIITLNFTGLPTLCSALTVLLGIWVMMFGFSRNFV
jgi:hypothetical protein